MSKKMLRPLEETRTRMIWVPPSIPAS
jgi:hypothetical protein